MRAVYKSIAVIAFFLVALFIYFYLGGGDAHLSLTKKSFSDLPGWEKDNQNEAFQAFKLSCIQLLKHRHDLPDWQAPCTAANELNAPDTKTARAFFEKWFTPYLVKNNFSSKGLFTGYYLPIIKASLKKDNTYRFPIYGYPNNLIKINLGAFKAKLAPYNFSAVIQGKQAVPYPDRAAISRGAIEKNAPVIAWCNSEMDLFFAQIQGSAIVELPNHKQFVIGYAGDNGYPYIAIGKVLVKKYGVPREQISMQTIREWLTKHPQEVDAVLNHNPSYVFFSVLKNSDPIGMEKVALTPNRSLAIDTHYILLGAPIWLETKIPNAHLTSKYNSYKHLLIAQDTGGAIRGVIRGDIYFGSGAQAEYEAGYMNQPGRYWILLPNKG